VAAANACRQRLLHLLCGSSSSGLLGVGPRPNDPDATGLHGGSGALLLLLRLRLCDRLLLLLLVLVLLRLLRLLLLLLLHGGGGRGEGGGGGWHAASHVTQVLLGALGAEVAQQGRVVLAHEHGVGAHACHACHACHAWAVLLGLLGLCCSGLQLREVGCLRRLLRLRIAALEHAEQGGLLLGGEGAGGLGGDGRGSLLLDETQLGHCLELLCGEAAGQGGRLGAHAHTTCREKGGGGLLVETATFPELLSCEEGRGRMQCSLPPPRKKNTSTSHPQPPPLTLLCLQLLALHGDERLALQLCWLALAQPNCLQAIGLPKCLLDEELLLRLLLGDGLLLRRCLLCLLREELLHARRRPRAELPAEDRCRQGGVDACGVGAVEPGAASLAHAAALRLLRLLLGKPLELVLKNEVVEQLGLG
jgi:hypothetical protein